jgi:nitroimidazol reductase NimA-like FMN-containing flavoprotein (pyridoxamine 5'-phosphate oxidase superfamily)
MSEIDPRTRLEVLDREECLALLARCSLGRIAVVAGDRPLVFPVNFALHNHTIVFRTDVGAKLRGVLRGPVAFECDGVDAVYHTGWSVLVNGPAEEVRNPAEIAELERVPLGTWAPGSKPIWVRIRMPTISGRRIPMPGSS